MGLLGKLIKEGTEAAATVIAHAVVTGADVIENAEKKRTELGRKFDEKAQAAVDKVERTRENLRQAVEDHVTAFAEAFEAAVGELEQGHRAPAPEATVTEATPQAVAATKPGLKTPQAPVVQAVEEAPKPKARKRGPRKPRKPSV
jgi:hypothetical protein